MIIAVGGIKGGTGKTTIATNLAVMRAAAGKKVLLVDADEQKSSSIWSTQRELNEMPNKPDITTIPLYEKALMTQLKKMKVDYDDIIIDVGGRETQSLRAAMAVCDIFVIPLKPSSVDMWTVEPIQLIILEMREANPKLKCIAVTNQAEHYRGNENDKTIQLLSGCEEIECFPYSIGQRKCFKSAVEEGLGISELEVIDKKALQEMQTLYDHIYTINVS